MQAHNLEIDVGNYRFSYAEKVEVESSWDMLTDEASIITPRKISHLGQAITQGESFFSRGDQVSVKLGYDGQYDQVFEGFVASVSPALPLRFRCEDILWQLKQNTHTLSYKTTTLNQLLSDIMGSVPYQAAEVELGAIRITKASTAQVLNHLKKEYGLQSWARGGTLYSGLAYLGSVKVIPLTFGLDVISDKLVYYQDGDLKVRVNAVSMLPNNTKIEVDAGDPGGDTKTLYFYNISSQSELKKLAEAELARLKVEGFSGYLTTFGQPQIQHGDTVALSDPKHPDRNGSYLVRKVITSGGVEGYRQRVYLDTRVS